ncbi:MAG: XRE family transcriptional regulator [Alcaligenaceae bacterium]|nr:MAG: XRE family transcriptional regulator [Alcaligenaceae bacterium]
MPDLQPDTLASRIKLARAALGLSQTGLAQSMGMSSAQLSRYESGANFPGPRIVESLASSLHVNVEWLRLGVGPRNARAHPSVGRSLRVHTTLLPEGGMEITFAFYDELREIFTERAYQEGVPLDVYLKNALLELAKEHGEKPNIHELARKVKELIEAGEV